MCLRQRLKPVLVQTLIAELAIEALDVAVVHRASGLDEDVQYAVSLLPGDEGAIGKLWTVIRSHSRWVAPEERYLIQQTHHVLA